MGRRRCCCERPNCTVFEDDFGDDEGAGPNSDWTSCAGTWTYTHEEIDLTDYEYIKEAGTSGAAILTVAETHDREQYVGCYLVNFDTGDIARLIVNAVDCSNYHFVEVEQGAADTTIRIYKREGGSNTLLGQDTQSHLEAITDFQVCSSDESITFSAVTDEGMTGLKFWVCNPVLFPTGKKAGLGNGGSQDLCFDGFYMENYHGDDGAYTYTPGVSPIGLAYLANPQCCYQQCFCVDGATPYCIPWELTVTFFNEENCAALDGIEVDLTYDEISGDWRSDPTQVVMACETDALWVFTCASNSCWPVLPDEKQWLLILMSRSTENCMDPASDECWFQGPIYWGAGGPSGAGGEDTFDCVPFSVTFQITGVTHPDEYCDDPDGDCLPGCCGACGEGEDPDEMYGYWHAVVTEKAP